MDEGLFSSLKNSKGKEKNTFDSKFNNENLDLSMNYTGWDGTPLPLPRNGVEDKDNNLSFGLPSSHIKAPWETQTSNMSKPLPQSTNTFPNSFFITQSQNEIEKEKNEDAIPASMYGYADVNAPTINNSTLDKNGNINIDPYSMQQNRIKNQGFIPNAQSVSNIQNPFLQQPSSFSQPYMLVNTTPSGINPFGNNTNSYGCGATGIEIEKPHDNVVIDRAANLQYIMAGKNNIAPGSSQYGLCDVSQSEWMKQNLILAIPFINIFYCIYLGYMQNFILYPTLKSWARGSIMNAVIVSVTWLIAIYSLLLTI